jgi:dTDP-4-dehydrorhamnose 3,5-epimerase
LLLDEFIDDTPWEHETVPLAEVTIENQIDGVILKRLLTNTDGRGNLTVLASATYDPSFAMPHVYHVVAEPGSVRAWVYHKRQADRLAYIAGDFRVVLYDMRPDRPSKGVLNILDVGAENPVQLTIPAFVIHGVQNRGATASYFVNMPTQAYDPARPDKSRLRRDHPGIPYSFD